MTHKHRIGVPVILSDTGELGVVDAQFAGPQLRYRIQVAGRPAIPGRPKGRGRTRVVDESVIMLGMVVNETAMADKLMRDFIRSLPVKEESTAEEERTVLRADLRTEKTAVRDNAASTDHEIAEALRYIEAINFIEAE